jgi:hypothetical protein
MVYIEVYVPPLHAVAVSCLLSIQAVTRCYYFVSSKTGVCRRSLGWCVGRLCMPHSTIYIYTYLCIFSFFKYIYIYTYTCIILVIKGSLGGETSVLRTFGMSGKELVKERVSEGKS